MLWNGRKIIFLDFIQFFIAQNSKLILIKATHAQQLAMQQQKQLMQQMQQLMQLTLQQKQQMQQQLQHKMLQMQ